MNTHLIKRIAPTAIVVLALAAGGGSSAQAQDRYHDATTIEQRYDGMSDDEINVARMLRASEPGDPAGGVTNCWRPWIGGTACRVVVFGSAYVCQTITYESWHCSKE